MAERSARCSITSASLTRHRRCAGSTCVVMSESRALRSSATASLTRFRCRARSGGVVMTYGGNVKQAYVGYFFGCVFIFKFLGAAGTYVVLLTSRRRAGGRYRIYLLRSVNVIECGYYNVITFSADLRRRLGSLRSGNMSRSVSLCIANRTYVPM